MVFQYCWFESHPSNHAANATLVRKNMAKALPVDCGDRVSGVAIFIGSKLGSKGLAW